MVLVTIKEDADFKCIVEINLADVFGGVFVEVYACLLDLKIQLQLSIEVIIDLKLWNELTYSADVDIYAL